MTKFSTPMGVAAAAVLAATTHAAPKTDISELVMYGVDADTHELLRYTFHNNEYTKIGVLIDGNGNVVEDNEAMAYIPAGPYAGFYTNSNFYDDQPSRVARVNGMDASAEWLPQEVGFARVEGMVAVRDASTDEWFLLATTEGETYDDDEAEGDPCLIAIDPATGRGTLIRKTAENYDGLAVGPDGTLWGVESDSGQLYTIDLATGNDNSTSGNSGYEKLESLEWAFGDAGALGVDTGVAPTSWTENGVLFSFSDDSDAFLILDPATGDAREYSCAFVTVDCEGLVFTTLSRDPYGKIVSDPHD